MPAGDLAVDYGTSNTVALIRSGDGHTRQLLFDASPLLASAIYAEQAGTLRAGRDAVRAARLDPTRYEPNPKRRIDDRDVFLGTRAHPVIDLIATTLRLVCDEAVRIAGQLPGRVVLTHPASWGSVRRGVLRGACMRAGLPDPVLVAEPVAAATYFAALPAIRLVPGQAVVVYDLGAGTFDASVVRWTGDGFETMAYRGLDDIGGLDFDALLVAHAGRGLVGGQTEAWQRIIAPTTVDDRRHHRLLWDDAREAKESLSRQNHVSFPLPDLGRDAMVTRAEFEAMAGPLLARTVEDTVAVIRESRVRPNQLAGLFLVGGGSRIPLVATLLHQRCRIAPTALEQPELVVAQGALAAAPVRASGPPRPPSAASALAAVSGPRPVPASPQVGIPLPAEQAWPSAPPTGPPQPLDLPARSGPQRTPDQPQTPPIPTRHPVWPAGARPGVGHRPPIPVWALILAATVVLILVSIKPAFVIIVAVLALLVTVTLRRRRRRRR
jgi:molecular chaperone DnaK